MLLLGPLKYEIVSLWASDVGLPQIRAYDLFNFVAYFGVGYMMKEWKGLRSL